MIAIQPAPWAQIGGGLLIVWISMLPALLYLQGVDRTPVPFLPAVGLYYFIFYGLPIFLSPLAFHHGDQVVLYERIVLNALDWDVLLSVAGGIGAMFAAFYVSKRTIFVRLARFRHPEIQLRADVLNIGYGILLLASLAYRLIPELASLPSIGQFFLPVGYLALGGFFLQWRAGRLKGWQAAIVALVLMPFDLYARSRFLFITDLMFIVAFFSFVLWRCRMMRTLAVVIAIGCAVALTYSATTAFRAIGSTFFEKLQASIDGASREIQRGSTITRDSIVGVEITYDPRISPLINRIGHIWVFQMVFERTPDPIPYWNGHTYRPLLTSLIPRVIYPDKPQERAGGEFGLRYGFTEGPDDVSSFNIPWMVELLANFGVGGVFLGMTLIGILLGGLDKFLNAEGASDLEFLIGLTVIFQLFYQESNFSVMVGSLPLLLLSLYLYFAIATRVVPVVLRRRKAGGDA